MSTNKTGKGEASKTQSAMGMALQQQRQKTKVIEKLVEKNIVTEVMGGRNVTDKRDGKTSLGEIAKVAAAKRKSADKKAPVKKPVAKKTTVKKTVAKKPEAQKPTARIATPKTSTSTNKATPRDSYNMGTEHDDMNNDRPIHIEIESLGKGVLGATTAGVGGMVGASKNVVGRVRESVKSGAKGAVDSVKGNSIVDSLAGSVAVATKTATDVTGKVADGAMGVVKGVGTVAGYVVTGAVAAPVDLVRGVSRLAGDLVGGISALTFGKREKKEND